MYRFESRVRYSEVDRNRKITLAAILDLLQDCCIFQSEHIGMGVDFLEKENRAWVLSSWQVVVNRYPSLGEKVVVSTWPYGFQSFMGYRNFIIEDEENNIIAYANSVWVFLDTISGRPVKVPPEILERFSMEEPFPMEYADRKISLLKEMEAKPPIFVQRFHIDTNQHVNNEKYVQMAEEYVPEELKVKELRVEYRKEAVLSDSIYPKVGKTEHGYMVSLDGNDGKSFAIVEFMEEDI